MSIFCVQKAISQGKLQIGFVKGVLVKGAGIRNSKEANEPMAHVIGKL